MWNISPFSFWPLRSGKRHKSCLIFGTVYNLDLIKQLLLNGLSFVVVVCVCVFFTEVTCYRPVRMKVVIKIEKT